MAFTTITVPLDGSGFAEAVLPTATDLTSRLGATLMLLSVVDPDDADTQIRYGIVGSPSAKPVVVSKVSRRKPKSTLKTEADAVRSYLRRTVEKVRRRSSQEIEVTTKVLVGDAADTIVKSVAGDEDAAIAIATHGWAGLQQDEVGSVAERVLRSAENPVITIRPTEERSVARALYSIRTVVVCLDGSRGSEVPIPLATRLAKGLDADLVFLKSSGAALRYSTDEAIHEAEQEDRLYLQHLIERAKQPELKLRGEGTSGAAASDIVEFGQENPGSLIVLTSRVRGGRARLVLGSVTDSVIRSGTSPVLVYPSPSVESQDDTGK